jgi:pSer/pThr/pTyr-binding forkhead associated (FHA) protein
MQDLTIRFTGGPQEGQVFEAEVGVLTIGRLPGKGGLELKGADSSVSRLHAKIVETDGDIVLENLSPNGTRVNGVTVLDRVDLKPESQIQIGPYTFDVHWSTFEDLAGRTKVQPKAKPAAKKGPLSSPVLRAVIGVYLGGIAAVALWLSWSGGTVDVPDDWPALRSQYESLELRGEGSEPHTAMLKRAEVLIRELRAQRIRGDGRDAERICRELMSLDADVRSPLYQYGARCLGSL